MTAGCWQNSQAHFGCHPSLEGLRADVDTAPINEAYLIRCDNQFDAFLIVTALVFIAINTGGKLKNTIQIARAIHAAGILGSGESCSCWIRHVQSSKFP